MRIEKYPCIIRALLEPERRAIRRSIERYRRRLSVGVRNAALFGASFFVVTSAVIVLDRRALPPPAAIATWLAVCGLISAWGAIRATSDLKKNVGRLQRTLQRNEVTEVTIQSTEVVEFEEEEDEGACYAFQLNGGRILFVSGQNYHPSARFPNTDFSFATIYDDDRTCVEELIYKRGQKLKPIRLVPAKSKSVMLIPDHLEMIEGKLSELEDLLAVASQDESQRTAKHA